MSRRDDWWFDHHPPCPNGCGELADECACPPARRNPLGSIRITTPDPNPYVEDPPMACRWRSCTQPAERGGYCDVHLATL